MEFEALTRQHGAVKVRRRGEDATPVGEQCCWRPGARLCRARITGVIDLPREGLDVDNPR